MLSISIFILSYHDLCAICHHLAAAKSRFSSIECHVSLFYDDLWLKDSSLTS